MTKVFCCALLLVLPLLILSPHTVTAANYQRSVESYQVPDVVLVNQHGERVRLTELLATDQPVIIAFMYTSCATICPLLSSGFALLQQQLGADSARVHLISISIDPETDSPKVLRDYLARFQAKPGWDFYTGSRNDIDRVMAAFSAVYSKKAEHGALNLIRMPEGGKWIRLQGIIGGSDFMTEVKQAGIQ
jgi:protein SCO1/2